MDELTLMQFQGAIWKALESGADDDELRVELEDAITDFHEMREEPHEPEPKNIVPQAES